MTNTHPIRTAVAAKMPSREYAAKKSASGPSSSANLSIGLSALRGGGAAVAGVLVAAIVGGAIIPLIQGTLADRIGLHTAFLLPAICYLYIVFYGFSGSKQPAGATA